MNNINFDGLLVGIVTLGTLLFILYAIYDICCVVDVGY